MPQIVPEARYANGKRKRASRAQDRLNEANAEEARRIMSTVLAQPHRRGVADPIAESPIGRFVLRYSLARECADAANEYATVYGKWRAAILAPTPDRIGGTGAEPDPKLVERWRKDLADWRRAMLDAGGKTGCVQVEWMAVERAEQPTNCDVLACMAALIALAKEMGRI